MSLIGKPILRKRSTNKMAPFPAVGAPMEMAMALNLQATQKKAPPRKFTSVYGK